MSKRSTKKRHERRQKPLVAPPVKFGSWEVNGKEVLGHVGTLFVDLPGKASIQVVKGPKLTWEFVTEAEFGEADPALPVRLLNRSESNEVVCQVAICGLGVAMEFTLQLQTEHFYYEIRVKSLWRFERFGDTQTADRAQFTAVLEMKSAEPATAETEKSIKTDGSIFNLQKSRESIEVKPAKEAPQPEEKVEEVDGFRVLWSGSFCCAVDSMYELKLDPLDIKLIFTVRDQAPTGIYDPAKKLAAIVLNPNNAATLRGRIDIVSTVDESKVADLKFFGKHETIKLPDGEILGCQVYLTVWIEPKGEAKKKMVLPDSGSSTQDPRPGNIEIVDESEFRKRQNERLFALMKDDLPALLKHLEALTNRMDEAEQQLQAIRTEQHEFKKAANLFVENLMQQTGVTWEQVLSQ